MEKRKPVYEYGRLYKKDLDDKTYQALIDFYGDDKKDSFPYYSLIKDGICFKQYVGILCVGDQVIEVLPKADKDAEGEAIWREGLLHMLRRVYKLDVKSPSNAPQKLSASAVLDIFINRFLNEVEGILNRGLVKCYHKEEGNLFSLKGKMLWGKQLAKNCVHKERFFVSYTTYDREHLMNRILRQALEIIPKITSNPALRGRATSTLFNFPELKPLQVTPETFTNLVFDRKTEDYKTAIEIAKLILLHYVPKSEAGKTDILALMFDMNKLWEEFIYRVLKRGLKGCTVEPQQSKQLWKSTTSNYKLIRPDILIKKNNNTYVLDTKWKVPEKSTPADGDLHQMYVYLHEFGAQKVALLYPQTGKEPDIHGEFVGTGGNNCDMLFLPKCEGGQQGHLDVMDWETKICDKVERWLN